MGQPLMMVQVQAGGGAALMMVQVQAGGGAASYDGTCAGWGWGSLL